MGERERERSSKRKNKRKTKSKINKESRQQRKQNSSTTITNEFDQMKSIWCVVCLCGWQKSAGMALLCGHFVCGFEADVLETSKKECFGREFGFKKNSRTPNILFMCRIPYACLPACLPLFQIFYTYANEHSTCVYIVNWFTISRRHHLVLSLILFFIVQFTL